MFGFYHGNRPCNGFREAQQRYRELVPGIKLAGWHEMSSHLQLGKLMIIAIWVHAISCGWSRANIICSYNWDCCEHCWWEWWSVPCTSHHSGWTGLSSYQSNYMDINSLMKNLAACMFRWVEVSMSRSVTIVHKRKIPLQPWLKLGEHFSDHDQDRLSATLQITADRIHQ